MLFMPSKKKGRSNFSEKQIDDHVEIRVRDSGPGIPQDHLESNF